MKLDQHDPEDIASYLKFPKEDLEKYFLHDCFGTYKDFEFKYSKTFGVMCTEEGLIIMNYLKAIHEFKSLDIKKFLDCKTSKEIVELLKDEEIYLKVFHLFAISLIDALKKYRKHLVFQKLFHTSPIFDGIVNVFVQELKNIKFINYIFDEKTRKDIFNQVVDFIEQNTDHSNPNPLDVSYFLKVLGEIELNMPDSKKYKLSFKHYRNTYKKYPQTISKFGFQGFQGYNSGVFLHGSRGTGKSGVLLYAAMWAHKMNWIVVSVPNVFKWTQLDELDLRRHEGSGLFLQPEYGVEFLEQFKTGISTTIKEKSLFF